ncbi:MoaD/ThiS family protein [Nocardia sp. GCM10030253]|uniref:MoaD/ThiS family protein n=1 Tax=Nocardia sp. GCM10030253 TaxID=3273404 RepID=UPI00362CE8F5
MTLNSPQSGGVPCGTNGRATASTPQDLFRPNARWGPSVVEIRYFAAIADVVGKSSEELEFPAGATISDLRRRLATSYGADLDKMLGVCAFVLGEELTRDPNAKLSPRVDVLPPFAGG